ncbi:putative transposase [Rhodococcus opacus B4]|uniref:Putative transposase n=1 Tax=Rhodococcus opacus (strain B4) TaxID=632772 RepID=C1B670_RHOOB|nr:putative transposase [Rhodococcus opacus B4]
MDLPSQRLSRNAPRMGTRMADSILTALDSKLSSSWALTPQRPSFRNWRSGSHRSRGNSSTLPTKSLPCQTRPFHRVLISMPGIVGRTTAYIITEVSGKEFVSAGHLASSTSLAPVTRPSRSSIRRELRSRRGNKKLKRVLCLSAFAAQQGREYRDYDERKRARGKSYNLAPRPALTRRRCDVFFAMLRDGTPCQASDEPPHLLKGGIVALHDVPAGPRPFRGPIAVSVTCRVLGCPGNPSTNGAPLPSRSGTGTTPT